MALSIGFRDSVSFLLTIQAIGFLTFALVGLSPTEYASLRWTHQHAGLSRRTTDGRQSTRRYGQRFPEPRFRPITRSPAGGIDLGFVRVGDDSPAENSSTQVVGASVLR